MRDWRYMTNNSPRNKEDINLANLLTNIAGGDIVSKIRRVRRVSKHV